MIPKFRMFLKDKQEIQNALVFDAIGHKQTFILTFFVVLTLSILIYIIIDQQKQINQLEQRLQHEQMKYKIIINDPLVRDAMEAGG